jgi:hypothetical protein
MKVLMKKAKRALIESGGPSDVLRSVAAGASLRMDPSGPNCLLSYVFGPSV